MQFDPSKFNTKPVNNPAPKAGVIFDPKTAAAEVAKKRELETAELQHAKLVASDPTKLRQPEQLGPVKAWSFSKLKKAEQCMYAVYLADVERIKVPEDPDGPMARGSRIHDLAEETVRDGRDIPGELLNFKSDFIKLQERFAAQRYLMTMEENWAFTTQWTPTDWIGPVTWARQKLDVFYKDGENNAVIIDHKTGKKFGNELKHGEQGLHYAIGAFMKYPELDFITTEFWYLDIKDPLNNKLRKNYTRERALIHLPKIHDRALILTTATEFPPKPSKMNCKWCDYRKSGDCEFAVEDF
jgi:CRISPR/Cas system-associated exonuclease Cas4 (RecB family)